jgi:hypothetical protein
MAIFANTIDGNDIYAKRAEQDKDGNPIRSVPSPGANEHRGEVLTVSNSDEVVWAAAGGGGLSPISPTTITPTLENNTYKIVIPGNNAYYIATINDTHNVEITPPTIGANEMYNVVLFVVSDDFGDKQMTMAYSDYGISPLDDESKYGWVYGHGFTQFILLGRGFTMKTSAYQGG